MGGIGADLGARLRGRDLTAAPAALNLVESRTPAARAEVAALLREVSPAALGGEAPAHVVGVTGPPGAGKSTLLGELVRAWRASRRTVAALAVDPSSRRSGGALLADRARIPYDPDDGGVFIRSTAAGGRLGGLAPATRAAAQALAAAFDVVAALREAGGADIPVVAGGIIPDADADALRAAGVAAVFTPKDFELTRILRAIVGIVADRHGVRSAA